MVLEMKSILEAAEQGHAISRAERKQREPELRRGLLEAQARLAETAEFPVLVLFGGVDGAGKGELANMLTAWMDPRRIHTNAYGEPSDVERARPEFWRYWRDLPPKGYLGIFLSAWYHRPLIDRAFEDIDDDQLAQRVERVLAFERKLVDDGALILKFWMHLGKAQQETRFHELEGDPHQSWRVTPKDWKHWRMYDRFVSAASKLIELTSTDRAPWTVVDGTDVDYRELTVGDHILRRMKERLGEPPEGAA